MLVSVSHTMSISPMIEYVAPASAVTYTELSPAIEYVAPTPVVTYAAPSLVIKNVAPALVVFHGTPATFGHKHEHIWKRKKDPMMQCTFFFLFDFSSFCSKLQNSRIISNFQNYHDQP